MKPNTPRKSVSVSQGGNRKKRHQTSEKTSTPPPSAEKLTLTSKDNKLFMFQVRKELEKIPKTATGSIATKKVPAVAKEASSLPPRRAKSCVRQKSSIDSKSQVNSSSSSLSREEETHSVKKELKKKRATIRQKKVRGDASSKTAESGDLTAVEEESSNYEVSVKKPPPPPPAPAPKNLSNKQDSKTKFTLIMMNFVAQCNRMNVQELYRQFNSLPDPTKEQCKAYLDVKNSSKNRYNNIYCLDKTRVELTFLAEGGYSKYIHANRVVHDSLAQPFIITQGPKKTTVVDFWRMIWQEKSMFVIMLCQHLENNRPKCSEYFNEEVGGCALQGPMQVTTVEKAGEEDGVRVTTLRVTYQGEERTVSHLMFPHWPDHEAPSPADFNHLFDILNRVRNAPSPVVVHCSAGVGRSGTLVALEMCVMDALKMRELNVLQTVRKLRGSRCYAVQTFPQYMCLFMALLHFGKERGALQDSDTAHFSALVYEYYRQQLQ